MNFESLKQFLEFKIIEKRKKFRRPILSQIRPEAEGLLVVATCCGSGPSQPHGPRALPSSQPARSAWARRRVHASPVVTTRWPRVRPAASDRATRCGESGGDSSCGKRGRCQARRNRQGRTEAAVQRWRGEVGSDCSVPVEGGSGGRWWPRAGGPATRGGGEGGCWWRVRAEKTWGCGDGKSGGDGTRCPFKGRGGEVAKGGSRKNRPTRGEVQGARGPAVSG
jgi:hypothetical protein